jgi:hypothetical protein
MEPKIQNTSRYLATKKIKQIMTTPTHNTLHKISTQCKTSKKYPSTKQPNNNESRQKQKRSHHLQKKRTKTKSGRFHTRESHILFKQRPDRHLPKTNPKRNSQMQHTDRQTPTEVPDKHKTSDSKT